MFKDYRKVSIICPCYNHELYVEELLYSLLAQTYNNIELLITDDCSKDKTYDVVLFYTEKLKCKFNNVIIKKNENNFGVAKTVNNMIKNSTGDYIKIIASDDFLDKDYIKKCVDYLDRNINYNFMFTDYYTVDEYSTFDNKKIKNKSNLFEFKDTNYYDELYRICWLPAPTAFFRRRFFDIYGLYNEEFLIEDYPKWLEAMEKESPGFLYEHLVYYRELKKSLSHGFTIYSEDVSSKYIKMWLFLLENYEKFVKNELCRKQGSLDKIYNAYLFSILGSNYKYLSKIDSVIKKYNIKVPVKMYVKLFYVLLKKFIMFVYNIL